MNWYDLSRAWFNFSFDNPEKIKPIHSAIFFFACEHCNRLGWKKKFGFPTSMVMEAIWIKKWETYNNWLINLVEWWFIDLIEKSKNQYSSCIISLNIATPKKKEALDIALVKHGKKHGSITGESTGDINKQVTNNKKQITIPTKIKNFSSDSFEYKIVKYFIDKQTELKNTSFVYLYKKIWEEKLIENWIDEIRKMKDIDKYTETQIEYIFKYLFTNDFWKEQISSIEKFRKKNKDKVPYFTILVNEAKKEQQKKQSTSIWAWLTSYF